MKVVGSHGTNIVNKLTTKQFDSIISSLLVEKPVELEKKSRNPVEFSIRSGLVHSLKLTFFASKMDGWNTILSYWVSVSAYLQVRTVRFREGKS